MRIYNYQIINYTFMILLLIHYIDFTHFNIIYSYLINYDASIYLFIYNSILIGSKLLLIMNIFNYPNENECSNNTSSEKEKSLEKKELRPRNNLGPGVF